MSYLDEDLARNLATVLNNQEKLEMDTFGITLHHYPMCLYEAVLRSQKRLKCNESNKKLQYGRVGKARYFDPYVKYVDAIQGRLYWKDVFFKKALSILSTELFSKEFVMFLEYVYTMHRWRMYVPVDKDISFIYRYSCGEVVFTIDDISEIIYLRSMYYFLNGREYKEVISRTENSTKYFIRSMRL